jgi:hypothetical protein
MRFATHTNRRVLPRLLYVAGMLVLAVNVAIAARGTMESVTLTRQAGIVHAAVASVPITRFAHACSAHITANDSVLLLDAGYGYGIQTMDGFDEWNAASFIYALLPTRVLIAPDVPRAQDLLNSAQPRYLAIWLQQVKRETVSLGLPAYARTVAASNRFQLILTYRDPDGDVGLLFFIR